MSTLERGMLGFYHELPEVLEDTAQYGMGDPPETSGRESGLDPSFESAHKHLTASDHAKLSNEHLDKANKSKNDIRKFRHHWEMSFAHMLAYNQKKAAESGSTDKYAQQCLDDLIEQCSKEEKNS